MELRCERCGHVGEAIAFKYICKIGILPTGVDEMRKCPNCGARVPLIMADQLEEEEQQIKELCQRLSEIPGNAPDFLLREAQEIIRKLSCMNMRWNVPQLDDFISQRQRELGLGMKRI